MSNFTYSATRTFSKRDESDTIGTAAWRVMNNGSIEFALNGGDFAPLPAASIEHLMTFALQTLQDAYAGKDGDDAKAAWSLKAEKIVTGSIGTRGANANVTPWQTVARGLVRNVVKTDASTAKAYKDGDAEERNAMLDAVIEKNRAKLEPAVAAELARLAATRETANGLAITL